MEVPVKQCEKQESLKIQFCANAGIRNLFVNHSTSDSNQTRRLNRLRLLSNTTMKQIVK